METFDKDFGKVSGIYLANSTNQEIRRNSSSGGFCKSMQVYLIESGITDAAILARTGPSDKPLKPETIITSSPSEIYSSRTNSIYAPINPLNVINKLDKNKRYSLVGLSCHIKELTNLKKKGLLENVIVNIGLLCHHTPKIEFTKEILKKLGLKEQELTQLEYRGNGWPGGFTAYLKDGSKKHLPTDDYWTSNLNNGLKKCFRCQEMSEDSDFVACDPWNLGLEKQDSLGRTLVICRNDSSLSLIKDAKERGYLEISEITLQELIKSQSKHLLDKRKRCEKKY